MALAASDEDIELQFSVADSGIGIEPKKHSLIFEAFAQADTSTTRNYGGSGLGLAICARLVGLMGGRIWVNSVVDRGSTFHFTARFGIAAGNPVAIVPSIESELLHMPVIVGDDNSTNRLILLEMTRSWGRTQLPPRAEKPHLSSCGRFWPRRRSSDWPSSMDACPRWTASPWRSAFDKILSWKARSS